VLVVVKLDPVTCEVVPLPAPENPLYPLNPQNPEYPLAPGLAADNPEYPDCPEYPL